MPVEGSGSVIAWMLHVCEANRLKPCVRCSGSPRHTTRVLLISSWPPLMWMNAGSGRSLYLSSAPLPPACLWLPLLSCVLSLWQREIKEYLMGYMQLGIQPLQKMEKNVRLGNIHNLSVCLLTETPLKIYPYVAMDTKEHNSWSQCSMSQN